MILTDRPLYSPRYSKATTFRDPVMQIFHRWVGSSILAHQESTGSVSLTQLFILWATHSQIRIDAGLFFAKNYLKTVKKRPTSARRCCIAFGSYITSLCRHHDVLHPRASLLGAMDLISITTLRNMGMIRGPSGQEQLIRAADVPDQDVDPADLEPDIPVPTSHKVDPPLVADIPSPTKD